MGLPVIHGFHLSPFVRAVRLTFEEKGASYELPPFNPLGLKGEAHLRLHPFGKMPAFEHDGFKLYETQAIIRYLDQILPGPSLTPADPQRAARMNQFIGIVDCYMFPALAGIVGPRIVAPLFGMPTDLARIEASIPNASTAMRAMETLLGAGPYLTGETLSLADLLIAPHITLLRLTPESQVVLDGAPYLAAWHERMSERPSLRFAAPDLQPVAA